MSTFRGCGSAFLALTACCLASAQDYYSSKEVRIGDLPSLTSKSRDPSEVLATSVQIILHAIRTLLLLDTRFSDERRLVAFNRLTDDWGKVQGLLMVKAALQ